MINLIKTAFRKLFPKTFAFIKGIRLLIHKESYLFTSGLIHTYRVGKPETLDGQPLPWMNYNVISFLKERLTGDLNLFEYGSGYSTYFYSKLAGKVTSVESNKGWFNEMNSNLPQNAQLIFKEEDCNGGYCRAVNEMSELFDVIVIDGRDRINCIRNSFNNLSTRGVIILDDSQRQEYQEGINFLLSKGFKKIDFEGLKPNGFTMDRTSIFYRAGNCLQI